MVDQYKIHEYGFLKYALDNGGSIHPLIIPSAITEGTGLMNPSVYNDNGRLLVNVRHTNYTLYHSEGNLFEHQFGPLQYLHPENDRALRTTNYICELNDNLEIINGMKVDTSNLDTPPRWEFTGLEDARLFRWNDKLYLCGVRRDTTHNGQGRMELSEISIIDNKATEISRTRIPVPNQIDTYCEKNWMPVLDKPYHFIKWSNPVELVRYDVEQKETFIESLDNNILVYMDNDLRGGSQVIPVNFDGIDYQMYIGHEVKLYNSEQGRKNGTYRHRVALLDKNWKITHMSMIFSFMKPQIEFCCGMCLWKNNILISFGYQDNAAYILSIPFNTFKEFLFS